MLSAAEARKIALLYGDVVEVLTRIENCIKKVAEEGGYALWYHLKDEDECFSEKIQKNLEAAGYKVDPFYENETYKFYINWRDASEE